MKICIMTSVHQHEDVRIYHKEAKALREQGNDVTILCPDYEGTDDNGINFVKVALPKSRFRRIFTAPFRFLRIAKKIDAKYYHFHDPELILTGLWLNKKAKVIYDVHEDVPRQILTKPYLKPFIAKTSSKIVELYENYGVKRFSAIISAAPVIYDRMKKLNRNTVLICNYPKLEEFAVVDTPYMKRENKLCYIGGITKIRGIFEMVEAVSDIDVTLVLAGKYESDELKTQVEQTRGYGKVDYLGFLNRTQISDILSRVKAGLVILHDTPTYIYSLPVKMFEYMAAGVPVIASDFPYWQNIVHESKCGLCANPSKIDEIKACMEYILKNPDVAEEMGQNGRKMILQKYNWDIEKEKLVVLYSKLDSLRRKH